MDYIEINGEKEKFKDINFLNIQSGLYLISDSGRIFYKKNREELKYYNITGYKGCSLKLKDGSYKKFLVHILVAKAFLKKTYKDKKFNRTLVHPHEFVKSVDNVRFLKYTNRVELSYKSILYYKYKDSNKKSYLETCAKYVYKLYKKNYNVDDILYVLEDYIKVKDINKFINNIINKKTYKYITDSLDILK